MDAKTDKEAILDALEDLEKTELEKFCSVLCDRREEPRIRRSTIQEKSRIEIADTIVRTFTDNAVEVTLDILKRINCNAVAQELENWREQDQLDPFRPKSTVSINSLILPTDSTRASLKSHSVDHLMSKLMSLQDNRDKYNRFEQTYKKVFQHNEKQVEITEKQIRAEFENLHQCLREEEQKRVSSLRKEEKQRAEIVTKEMKNIQEQISSLSNAIDAIENKLHFDSDSDYLCTLPEPQLVSGVLIDVDKHLGNLTYRVCEEIRKKVTFSPVILDPNTAHSCLCLSEDLTSVRDRDTWQQLPNNPERFIKYPSVLGSKGFSSGTHTWEVEVGDHPRWNIGYVRKSVDRKGVRHVRPREGMWCLCRHGMIYTNGVEYLPLLQRNPQRIRVQLDYSEGKVSFYDTEDMTHIYTHKDNFSEKLYPYLNYGKTGDAETTDIRICQVAQGCPQISETLPKSYRRRTQSELPKSLFRTQTLPKPLRRTQTFSKPSHSTQNQRDSQRDRKQPCVLQ